MRRVQKWEQQRERTEEYRTKEIDKHDKMRYHEQRNKIT